MSVKEFQMVNGFVVDTKNLSKKRIVGKLPKELNYSITKVYHTINSGIDDTIIEVCDNCGKHILNVALLKSSDNKEFKVGLDCASTLSNINKTELERAENTIKEAKSIRARIQRAIKSRSDLKVEIEIYNGNMSSIVKDEEKTYSTGSHYPATYYKYDYGYIVKRFYSDSFIEKYDSASYGNTEMWNDVIMPYISDLAGTHNTKPIKGILFKDVQW